MRQLMDRGLKERIVGASVLVIFAVLIVPVFLDGPGDDTAIVSESVTLPGQNADAGQQQTIVLERDRSEPVPAAATDDRQPEKAAATARKAPSNESARAAAPVTASATGMWAVQLGSFSDQENATRLAADLRKAGYAAFLSKVETASGSLHRVRVGPQKDRDSAEEIAASLGTAGHDGQVVPHP